MRWRDQRSSTSEAHFELSDVKRDKLRAACAAVDDAFSHMPTEGPASAVAAGLRAQWANVVALLALEPARALRECPHCGQVGMLEATRCGHCWAKLPAATGDAIPS